MRAIIQFPRVKLGHGECGRVGGWAGTQDPGPACGCSSSTQGHLKVTSSCCSLQSDGHWLPYNGYWYRKMVRGSNRNYLVNTSLLGWWGRCWKANVESLAQDLLSQLSLEGGSAAPCHDWLQEIFTPDIMDPAGPRGSWWKVLWWASWAEMEE